MKLSVILLCLFAWQSSADSLSYPERVALSMKMSAIFATLNQKNLPRKYIETVKASPTYKSDPKKVDRILSTWSSSFSKDINYQEHGDGFLIGYKQQPLIYIKVLSRDPFKIEINSNTRVTLKAESFFPSLEAALRTEGYLDKSHSKTAFEIFLPKAFAESDNLQRTFLNSVFLASSDVYKNEIVKTPATKYTVALTEQGYLLPTNWFYSWIRNDHFKCDGETVKGTVKDSEGGYFDFEASRKDGVTFSDSEVKLVGKIKSTPSQVVCRFLTRYPELDSSMPFGKYIKSHESVDLALWTTLRATPEESMPVPGETDEAYDYRMIFLTAETLLRPLVSDCKVLSRARPSLGLNCATGNTVGDVQRLCKTVFKAGPIAPSTFKWCVDNQCQEIEDQMGTKSLSSFKAALPAMRAWQKKKADFESRFAKEFASGVLTKSEFSYDFDPAAVSPQRADEVRKFMKDLIKSEPTFKPVQRGQGVRMLAAGVMGLLDACQDKSVRDQLSKLGVTLEPETGK